jgi:hypothetical protein
MSNLKFTRETSGAIKIHDETRAAVRLLGMPRLVAQGVEAGKARFFTFVQQSAPTPEIAAALCAWRRAVLVLADALNGGMTGEAFDLLVDALLAGDVLEAEDFTARPEARLSKLVARVNDAATAFQGACAGASFSPFVVSKTGESP